MKSATVLLILDSRGRPLDYAAVGGGREYPEILLKKDNPALRALLESLGGNSLHIIIFPPMYLGKGIIEAAAEAGLSQVYIHAVGEQGAEAAEKLCREYGFNGLTTVIPLPFDIKKAYNTLMLGKTEEIHTDAAYGDKILCGGAICAGDAVVFASAAPDGSVELARALTQQDYGGFPREKAVFPVLCLGITPFEFPGLGPALSGPKTTNFLGRYLSRLKLKQLRFSCPQRSRHMRYYFDGGLISLPEGIDTLAGNADTLAGIIKDGKYDFIAAAFNPASGGEAGELIEKLAGSAAEAGGVTLVLKIGDKTELSLLGSPAVMRQGGLVDAAPTLLSLMGLKVPDEMTGISLID